VDAPLNVLAILENGLFALGQVLRFPVMTLLWVCVAAGLFMSGSCFVEFVARRRERRGFDLDRWLQQGPVLDADEKRRRALPASLRELLDDVEEHRAHGALADGGFEHLVMEREERERHRLNGSRALVKVGPSLGLVGTLIPMGASLASLASGNLQAMAGQMVVAFTTTIIGLATGTAAYMVTVVRQGWVNQTVREQRYLAERIAGELERESRNREVVTHGAIPSTARA
jgi:biopolymer transport protein ExbB/TolQ